MTGKVLTYSPDSVRIELSGYELTGITSISVAMSSPRFSMVRGIRGYNTRKRTKDTSSVLTITVLQTSVTNTILAKILASDMVYGTAKLSVSIQDTGSRDTFVSSSNAFIVAHPTLEYQEDASTRTWEIAMLTTTMGVGGAYEPPISLFGNQIGLDTLTNLF